MEKLIKEKFKNLVLREARKLILEVEVTDKELRAKIGEFYDLQMKASNLEAQLKEAKEQLSQAKDVLKPLLDNMQELGDKMAYAEKYVIEVKKFGYERKVTSYKDAFALSLTKVNGAIKKILIEAVDATKKVSEIAPSFTVKKADDLTEAGVKDTIKSALTKVKSAVKKFGAFFKREAKNIDAGTKDLEKAVEQAKKAK
jgi:hypothetical protein